MEHEHEQKRNDERRPDEAEFLPDDREDEIGVVFRYIDEALAESFALIAAGTDGPHGVRQLEAAFRRIHLRLQPGIYTLKLVRAYAKVCLQQVRPVKDAEDEGRSGRCSDCERRQDDPQADAGYEDHTE